MKFPKYSLLWVEQDSFTNNHCEEKLYQICVWAQYFTACPCLVCHLLAQPQWPALRGLPLLPSTKTGGTK